MHINQSLNWKTNKFLKLNIHFQCEYLGQKEEASSTLNNKLEIASTEYRIMPVTKFYPELAVLYQISPISGQSKSICQVFQESVKDKQT